MQSLALRFGAWRLTNSEVVNNFEESKDIIRLDANAETKKQFNHFFKYIYIKRLFANFQFHRVLNCQLAYQFTEARHKIWY